MKKVEDLNLIKIEEIGVEILKRNVIIVMVVNERIEIKKDIEKKIEYMRFKKKEEERIEERGLIILVKKGLEVFKRKIDLWEGKRRSKVVDDKGDWEKIGMSEIERIVKDERIDVRNREEKGLGIKVLRKWKRIEGKKLKIEMIENMKKGIKEREREKIGIIGDIEMRRKKVRRVVSIFRVDIIEERGMDKEESLEKKNKGKRKGIKIKRKIRIVLRWEKERIEIRMNSKRKF